MRPASWGPSSQAWPSSEDDPSHPDLERLLHAADCAMYTAKQEGKNRVHLAERPRTYQTAKVHRLP